MNADCRNFRVPSASEFPDVERFSAEETSTQIITQELTLTLYAIQGGNVMPHGISAAEFNEN
jgi:hypothetical protein